MNAPEVAAASPHGEGAAARPDLAERLAFVAGSLNRRLRPPADALTHVAVSALASIDRLGAVRPGELARIEGIAAPGMTRLVTELEHRGLVTRSADPADGRSQLVRLTPAGTEAVAQARRERAAGVASILAEVAPDDLPALESAIATLEAALLATTPGPGRTA
ncbi:MarR family winged helix-turn-helix transcriptional regulator [Amnibacterium sp.]|uniref:MarR family winged helix-turn-helix transcriptional regulator n=1 Tax=Amnibacterium sp. TaxID=1872496 RepID=UPI003F7CACF6